MTMTLYPVTTDFVAEIGDIDLSKPLAAAQIDEIKQALWQYGVLIFPEQHLTTDQHLAFASVFGPVESDRIVDSKGSQSRVDNRFSDVSNLNADGKIWSGDSRRRMYKAGNRQWHTDSSFRIRPGLCSLLYAAGSIPPVGGQTEFANQRAAYDALSPEMQARLEGLITEHSLATSRRRAGFSEFTEEEERRMAKAPQLLVRIIPETGKKSLYMAAHVGRIIGMPEADSTKLIDQLMAHITQRQFVYSHRWRPNELVIWDNRRTMHRGKDYDDLRWARDMRRVTIADVANTCVQEGVALPTEAAAA